MSSSDGAKSNGPRPSPSTCRARPARPRSAGDSPGPGQPRTWARDPGCRPGQGAGRRAGWRCRPSAPRPARRRTVRATASGRSFVMRRIAGHRSLLSAIPARSRSSAASRAPPTPRRRRRAACRRRRPCPPARPATPGRAPRPPHGRTPAGYAAPPDRPSRSRRPPIRPCTRRRWSLGAPALGLELGDGVDRVPPGTRTLIAPISSRSRDTVAWVAVMPSSARSSTSRAWLVTVSCPISVRWLLPLALAPGHSAHGPPAGTARSARAACRRLGAWGHTRLRPVDHVGAHLLARGGQAGSAGRRRPGWPAPSARASTV